MKPFNNIKIKNKLFIIFGMLATIILGFIVFAVLISNDTGERTKELLNILFGLAVGFVLLSAAALFLIAGNINRNSEYNKMLAIMDNLDSMICVSDLDYNLLYANKTLFNAYNINEETCIGRKCYNVIRKNDKPCSICHMAELMTHNQSLQSYDFEYVWDETLGIWLEGRDSIIRWTDGSLVHFQIMRDVTNKKFQEELIERQNAELIFQTSKIQTMFDSIPDILFVKDLDLRFVQCNKALEVFFNRRKEDIIGKRDMEYFGFSAEESARIIENEQSVLREDHKTVLEDSLSNSSGIHFFETIKVPLKQNDTIIGLIGIIREITERKEMEKKALSASNAKSKFLANMSHEIRTPMNAIMGITEIQLQNKTLAPDVKEALKKIYSSGNLLLNIINDILDLSKIEAGKLDLSLAEYEVASLINDTVTLNITRVGSKPIKFEIAIDENIPFVLFGDELRIKQILNNLLSNAFKYTDEGVVKLSICFEKGNEDKESDGTLVCAVSDTGHGMSEYQVSRLFDEYIRFSNEANRMTEGTGLGMSITRNLLNIMKGDISVKSELHKGSEFTVRIPQKTVGSGVLGKEIAEMLQTFQIDNNRQLRTSQIIFEPMPYGSILLVDDVEANLYVAKGLMAPYELKIDSVMSGSEAVYKIKYGGVYDIIFMDHMMPVMDGIETTKKIREMGYTNPIIALTANAIVGQSEVFMANGFDDFISKPIDIRQLNSVLKRFVRNKQPSEVADAAALNRQKTKQENQIPKEAQKLSVNNKLAEIFIRDANKIIAALEKVMEKQGVCTDDDIRSYTISVHGMKSALANINEPELSAFAAKLEQAGREKNIGAITSETPGFITELRKIIEKLTPGNDRPSA